MQTYFSQRPFSAWNFDCITRASFHGEYSFVGLIGLASDDNNFIIGYLRNGFAGIAKMRDGVRTTLAELVDDDPSTDGISEDIIYDVRFWHRDGLFGLEYKLPTTVVWPTRGSQLTYSWKKTDGPIVTIDDIFHVGILALIDPPRFRTTGFKSNQIHIPVLPLDRNPVTNKSDFLEYFNDVLPGQVDIEGKIFTYTSCNRYFLIDDPTPARLPCGPYQFRIARNIKAPYNAEDGFHFQGGKSIEFLRFAWLVGADHYLDDVGTTIGLSNGFSFVNEQTQWKPWVITTNQRVTYLERSRYYSETVPPRVPDNSTFSDRVYITNSLEGVAPKEENMAEADFQEGTFVFLDDGDKIDFYGFSATSGDHDYSIRTLLKAFAQIAGTSASFPADTMSDMTLLPELEWMS